MPPRQGLLHSEIIFPAGADEAATLDRESLWNAAEAREHRRDSNTALLWHIALPRELDTLAAIDLAKSFAHYLIEREDNVIDLTVRETSPGSLIGYLLATTRQFRPSGFGAKIGFLLSGEGREKRGLSKSPRSDLAEIRPRWAELVNAALESAGSSARVDHRSLKDRGYDLIPQLHLGSAAARRDLYKQIPPIRSTDLLLEVDATTGFAEAFTHLRTEAPCADRIGLMNISLPRGSTSACARWPTLQIPTPFGN